MAGRLSSSPYLANDPLPFGRRLMKAAPGEAGPLLGCGLGAMVA